MMSGMHHSFSVWCQFTSRQGKRAGVPAIVDLASADADAGANILRRIATHEKLAAKSTDLMSRVDEQVCPEPPNGQVPADIKC